MQWTQALLENNWEQTFVKKTFHNSKVLIAISVIIYNTFCAFQTRNTDNNVLAQSTHT